MNKTMQPASQNTQYIWRNSLPFWWLILTNCHVQYSIFLLSICNWQFFFSYSTQWRMKTELEDVSLSCTQSRIRWWISFNFRPAPLSVRKFLFISSSFFLTRTPLMRYILHGAIILIAWIGLLRAKNPGAKRWILFKKGSNLSSSSSRAVAMAMYICSA